MGGWTGGRLGGDFINKDHLSLNFAELKLGWAWQYVLEIVHLEQKVKGQIICLLAIYYPLKAFGYLDLDLDKNIDYDQ